MTIEIHEPELEALIDHRMASGAFETVEDALLQALRSAPLPAQVGSEAGSIPRSGIEIFEALQRCPYPEVDIEPSRPVMPVREFTW